MALTRNFKETVQARVLADPAFREALLREGVEAMLAGDVDTGKLILRDYIKATVGFEELGAETGTSAKSLIRMFGARGNPQARNFFAVLSRLQERAGLRLQVTTQPRRRTTAPTRNAKALNRTAAVARRVGAANC
jgi:DNA-binding phage protein